MNKRYVLDIETDLAHSKIWIAVLQDIDTGEVICHTEKEKLAACLKHCGLLVGHNVIGFDLPVLRKLWKITLNSTTIVRDTLVMSRLLRPDLENGHSLASWGERLKTPKADYRKAYEERKGAVVGYAGEEFDHPYEDLLQSYCITDVDVCRVLYGHLVDTLSKLKFSEKSIELEHRVAAIIRQQEANGWLVDMRHTTTLYAQLMQRQEEIKTQLQLVFPPITTERFSEKTGKKLKDSVVEFNPGSRQQIADRLISLGWKPTDRTEGGGWKVDETVLSGVDIPEAKLVAEYLMLVKRTSQIQSWIDAVKDDGRIHGKVITNGAVTGRMTHSSPNMAQVPASGSPYGKECRACFIVPKGKKLVGCDASGLELRMLAHYMQDPGYTESVVNGKREDGTDIHTVNQKSAGLPTRDNAKTFIYAFLYGAGDAKIGSIVGGTAAEGKKLKNRFLRQTPSLKKLIEKVQKIGACGSLPGLDGRRVWIRSDHAALNTLLQSAGAIVMKQALIHLQEKLECATIDALFVGNIHDELQIEVDADKAEEVGMMAKQSIIEAGITLGLRCPLDGDYAIGNSWADTH